MLIVVQSNTKYIMRAKEIIKRGNRVKQYLIKVKIRSPGYTNIVDIDHALVNSPKELF